MPTVPLIASATTDERTLVLYLGAIGIVIVIASLVSGLVERLPVSPVLVFVALGVLLGPHGTGTFDLGLTSPLIVEVASVALTLVLFTDAMTINLGQLRTNWLPAALVLGPGALLTIALIAVAALGLFRPPPALALLVGAILASTDGILVRDLTRDHRVPLAIRHTLRVEAGANDLIVLPLVLVLASLAAGHASDLGALGRLLFGIVIVAPVVGVVVALVAVRLMAWLRQRRLVRREYESIYSLGVALVAFAAAQLLGGSGFLAAFAAGLTILFVDVDLCDCFLEYGETTAEVAMLVTFVLLGSTIVTSALAALDARTLVFAAFTLLVARPLAMLLVLAKATLSRDGKLVLAWFGPRGLGSILLLIVALAEGVPAGDGLTGVVCLVVLASVVLHGLTGTPLARWYGRRATATELPEETIADAGKMLRPSPVPGDPVRRIRPEVLKAMLDAGEPVTVIDTRRLSGFPASGDMIAGALRIPVDEIPARAATLPKGPPIVLYCA